MDNKTGGAAFPTLRTSHDPEGNVLVLHDGEDGLTLRDYFAVRCPTPSKETLTEFACILTGKSSADLALADELIAIAHLNYHYADAMLNVRKIPNENT